MKNILIGLVVLVALSAVPLKAQCLEEKLYEVVPQGTLEKQLWLIIGDPRFNRLFLFDTNRDGTFNRAKGDYYMAYKGHVGSQKVSLDNDPNALARMPVLFHQGVVRYKAVAAIVVNGIDATTFTVNKTMYPGGIFSKYSWRLKLNNQNVDVEVAKSSVGISKVQVILPEAPGSSAGQKFIYAKNVGNIYKVPTLIAKVEAIIAAMGNATSKTFQAKAIPQLKSVVPTKMPRSPAPTRLRKMR